MMVVPAVAPALELTVELAVEPAGTPSDLNASSFALSSASGNPAIDGIAPGERPSGPWQFTQGPARTLSSSDVAPKAVDPQASSSVMPACTVMRDARRFNIAFC